MRRFYADVVAVRELKSLAEAEALRGQHVWRDEVIAERFDWGRDKCIFALALRVTRLPKTIELPMRPEYGGCKSWIELEGDVPVAGAKPVLSDVEFNDKLKQFHAALASVGAP